MPVLLLHKSTQCNYLVGKLDQVRTEASEGVRRRRGHGRLRSRLEMEAAYRIFVSKSYVRKKIMYARRDIRLEIACKRRSSLLGTSFFYRYRNYRTVLVLVFGEKPINDIFALLRWDRFRLEIFWVDPVLQDEAGRGRPRDERIGCETDIARWVRRRRGGPVRVRVLESVGKCGYSLVAAEAGRL